MPPESLSPLAEKILATVWKLNALSNRAVSEGRVKTDLAIAQDELTAETQKLQTQGFLSRLKVGEEVSLSLTHLGLAILRQIEEDNLQELK
ncbi:MAG TPA: hypothetical protein VJZ03_03690 [Candidatus Bathyarchaeia archaeon]|nr:hypothetical protein [Candidatus Bathyarchaeia archaeon]